LLPLERIQVDTTSSIPPATTDDDLECAPPIETINNSTIDGNDNTTEVQIALNELFILCETGEESKIEFILNKYPMLQECLNDRHICHVSNTHMELTPLQLTAACGHSHIIKLLLSIPVISCNLPEPLHLMTALHIAVTLGQCLAVKALCEDPKVELNAKNIDGKTALHIAIELEDIHAIEIICRLRPQVDLRIKDFDGNNAMHFAAFYPNERIMRLLVHQAASMNYYSIQVNSPRPISIQSKRIFYSVKVSSNIT